MPVQWYLNTNGVSHSFVSSLHEDTSISALTSPLILVNQVLGPAKVWLIWVLGWHGVELNNTGQYFLPDISFIALVILLNAGFEYLNSSVSNTKGHTQNTGYVHEKLNRLFSLVPLQISDLTLNRIFLTLQKTHWGRFTNLCLYQSWQKCKIKARYCHSYMGCVKSTFCTGLQVTEDVKHKIIHSFIPAVLTKRVVLFNATSLWTIHISEGGHL